MNWPAPQRPVLVGWAPVRGEPEPLGVRADTGRRLVRLLRCDDATYLDRFERVNVLAVPTRSGKETRRLAEAGAARLTAALRGRVVVLVGRDVAAAFGQRDDAQYFSWRNALGFSALTILPYPSARNRWYNDAKNTQRAGDFLRDLLATGGPRMGRPTLLTPELADKVATLHALGMEDKQVSEAVGIDPATFRVWRRKGERGESPYDGLLALMAERAGTVEARIRGGWVKATEEDWRAGVEWLRSHRPEFAARTRGLEGRGGIGPSEVTVRVQMPSYDEAEVVEIRPAEPAELRPADDEAEALTRVR